MVTSRSVWLEILLLSTRSPAVTCQPWFSPSLLDLSAFLPPPVPHLQQLHLSWLQRSLALGERTVPRFPSPYLFSPLSLNQKRRSSGTRRN